MPHAHFVRGPTPVTVLGSDASYRRAAPGKHLTVLPAAREAFYESGCQGRTPPALIAVVFGPWQPAPLLAWARPFGLPGFAGQSSSSASFSSGSGTGSIGTWASERVALGEPWFYLRLDLWGRPDASSGSAGGPMVRRVPRRTCGRANASLETAPRTWGPGLRSRWRGQRPLPRPRGSGR